jgi:hypothetical protein
MSGTGSKSGPKNGYEDFCEIDDADGVTAVISRRVFNGDLAVGIFRKYERDGVTEKTSFMPVRQIDAAIRVLEIAKERMQTEADRQRAAARVSNKVSR